MKSCLLRYPDSYESLTVDYACTTCQSLVNRNSKGLCSNTQYQYLIDSLSISTISATIKIDNFLIFELNNLEIVIGQLVKQKTSLQRSLIESLEESLVQMVTKIKFA